MARRDSKDPSETLQQLTILNDQNDKLTKRLLELHETIKTLEQEIEILEEENEKLSKVSSLQAISGILNGKHLSEDQEITRLLKKITKDYLRSLSRSLAVVSNSEG